MYFVYVTIWGKSGPWPVPHTAMCIYSLRHYSGYLLLFAVCKQLHLSLACSDITMLWAEGVECLSVHVSSPPVKACSQRLNRSNVSAALVPVSITKLQRARAVYPGTHILTPSTQHCNFPMQGSTGTYSNSSSVVRIICAVAFWHKINNLFNVPPDHNLFWMKCSAWQ